jgi:hypothetical protein
MPKVQKRIKEALTVALSLVGVGCAALHPAAEGAFAVKGRILASDAGPAPQCTLDVYLKKGDRLVRQVDVSGQFSKTVLVAPGVHEYYMVLHCAGSTARVKTNVYKLGNVGSVENPVDLGEIDLRSQTIAPSK